MKVFDSMIFFGLALLAAGIFLSWGAINFVQDCNSNQDGIDALNQCPPVETPWNLVGLYVLPGIVLLSSAIFLKKKSK
jgi:hypothetical protein